MVDLQDQLTIGAHRRQHHAAAYRVPVPESIMQLEMRYLQCWQVDVSSTIEDARTCAQAPMTVTNQLGESPRVAFWTSLKLLINLQCSFLHIAFWPFGVVCICVIPPDFAGGSCRSLWLSIASAFRSR